MRSALELFATILTTGAATMTIEILGTRVIAPVFGVNLFVWTALITVTLASLATGYFVGGLLVDRFPTLRLLSSLVLTAGALLSLVPLMSSSVLGVTEGLGPRGGPLVASLVLFAPALVTLGATGPAAVRLAISEVRRAGRIAGTVTALSTVGSVLGTLSVGFLLVPTVETRSILLATAALLVLVGAVPLAFRGKPTPLTALVLPLLTAATHSEPVLPEGIRITASSQSLYGLVQVIQDEKRGVRLLRADHSIIGAEFLRDGSGAFTFLHQLEALRFVRPRAKDVLQIGLGAGSVPSSLERYGLRVEAVEIDPTVVRFATEHFGTNLRGPIHIEDARLFLNRANQRYDLVLHDTFTGGTAPEHLLSLEVLRRIHAILRPGGVLALTFPSYERGPGAEALWAVARTIRAVFPHTRIFRDHQPTPNEADTPSNFTFFASDAPLTFDIPNDAQFENSRCEHAQRSMQAWELTEPVPDAAVITDERNPLARLQLPIANAHFQAMRELLPLEIWLQ